MSNIKSFVKREITGWKPWELTWIAVCLVVILGLSLYWGDSLMGIISSSCGVLYTLFVGKGKLSAYLFGLINSILYAIISFKSGYFGETMLNALYYVPMQFVGFYVWRKNMNEDTNEVNKRYMRLSGRFILIGSIILSTLIYGLFLRFLGDELPFIDSFTTVSSVIAMIISVKMYAEQWWIWLAVNGVSVYMWWVDFKSGSDNMATLLMWIIFLINSVILMVKWELDIKKLGEAAK